MVRLDRDLGRRTRSIARACRPGQGAALGSGDETTQADRGGSRPPDRPRATDDHEPAQQLRAWSEAEDVALLLELVMELRRSWTDVATRFDGRKNLGFYRRFVHIARGLTAPSKDDWKPHSRGRAP